MMAVNNQSLDRRTTQLMKITFISFFLFLRTSSAPIYLGKLAVPSVVPPASALTFMKKFGYLVAGSPDSEAQYSASGMTEAIKTVQRFGNIEQTGIFDNKTLELMVSPRCGLPDVIRHQDHLRRKRFILGSEGWKKRNITYYVANWSPKLGEEAVVDEMERAFDAWSGYARLNFRHINDPNADIIIAFGRGPHGDGYPFDGPGNVLAHAYFPYEMGSYGGDMHFDDDEEWKIRPTDPEEGTDFFTVAVHELGHSLGLSHSPVPTSIMFPYYRGYTSNFQLDYDDILGMYQLYTFIYPNGDITLDIVSRQLEGDRSTTENITTQTSIEETTTKRFKWSDEDNGSENVDETHETTTQSATEETSAVSNGISTATETNLGVTFTGDDETVDEHRGHEAGNGIPGSAHPIIPDICEGNFDTVSVFREELFIFKEEYLWRLMKRGKVENGYPVKFHQLFHDLPRNITRIDAAYQRETDANIILFTGNQYWIYDGDKFISGSPRPLTDYGISPDVDRIDAAQVWAKNGKTYLYRGDIFWRFNETSQTLDEGYPHNMRRWRGVPTHIDAAMTWTDGKTYFFKDKLFWKFDNFLIKTDDRYPLPAPQNWIGCPERLDTIWW